jgi:hypothetical protein
MDSETADVHTHIFIKDFMENPAFSKMIVA